MTDNEKIAMFMGSKYYKHVDMWDVANATGDIIFYAETNDLAYHLSWDWLMPVVQKCWDICDQYTSTQFDFDSISSALCYIDIKKTHLAVIDCINWYNENKKP